MPRIKPRWAIEVGDEILTPFGVATVLSHDVQRDGVVTTKGNWGMDEVDYKEPPGAGEDIAEWLLGPRYEVRTTYDQTTRKCSCGCGCLQTVMVHKLTGREIFQSHTPPATMVGCTCREGKCPCRASV